VSIKILFIITELVQGEGGVNVASKKFVKNLNKTSIKYDIPLIIDEVQTGLGRIGKWWTYQHYDIKPDIVTIAKALQVGAVVLIKSSNHANLEFYLVHGEVVAE
jgi:4-aminobutyrate aminotransferase